MSQSPNPNKDNQALLHSMLQRLKLQPPGTTTFQPAQYSPTIQNAPEKQTSDLQAVNNNSVNGFESMDNIKKAFVMNGEIQEFGGFSVNRDQSKYSSSQIGQPVSPTLSKTSILSEGSASISNSDLKKDMTSDLETGESTRQNQDQNSGFVPRTYAWSLKNSDGQDINKVTFGGGEMFGATGQNAQTPVFSGTNTASIRKQRRWTQKIKEKWRERPGSFGKKGKGGSADMTKQENLPQYKPLTENVIPISNEVPGDSTDHPKSLTPAEDGSDEYMRSTGDFDLGLGSFSLLDEIVRGQEWAKFLSPTKPASSHEKPSEQTINQPVINYLNSNPASNSASQEAGSMQWIFGKTRVSSKTDVAMTQVSVLPEALLAISMDTTEKHPTQNQVQSEPMDHGQSLFNLQMTKRDQPLRPQCITKAELRSRVDTLTLKARNRKRQHDSSERIEAKLRKLDLNFCNGNDPVDDGSVFLPDNHGMNLPSSQLGRTMAVSSPCSPVPKGVLKYSSSYDRDATMETETKKNVEGSRRVRFSEEIIAIDPPELGPDVSYSDEEDEEDEDSLIDEDNEEHTEPSAAMLGFGSAAVRPEEAAPARRTGLTDWIRGFKKKNSGKKPRQ